MSIHYALLTSIVLHVARCSEMEQLVVDMDETRLNEYPRCSNLYLSSETIPDISLTECLDYCISSDSCMLVNYFDYVLGTNDKKCYVFNEQTEDSCLIKSVTLNSTHIYYKNQLHHQVCMDFRPEWIDDNGATCDHYEELEWCVNGSISDTKSVSDFEQQVQWSGSSIIALDACCICGGGLPVIDKISMDISINASQMTSQLKFDVLDQTQAICSWDYQNYHSARIQLSVNRNRIWNNFALYDFCNELVAVNPYFEIECLMFIYSNLESPNLSDEYLVICNESHHQTSIPADEYFLMTHIENFDSNESYTFINANWFQIDTSIFSSTVNPFYPVDQHILYRDYSQCLNAIYNVGNNQSVDDNQDEYGIEMAIILICDASDINDTITTTNYLSTSSTAHSNSNNDNILFDFFMKKYDHYPIYTILVLVTIALICICSIGLCYCCYRRRKKSDEDMDDFLRVGQKSGSRISQISINDNGPAVVYRPSFSHSQLVPKAMSSNTSEMSELVRLKQNATAGVIYYQLAWYSKMQMSNIDSFFRNKYNLAPAILFGDNDDDRNRPDSQIRAGMGGQARYAGNYDRSFCYGITTTFMNNSYSIPSTSDFQQLMDSQFAPLEQQVLRGSDVVVPAATKKDLNGANRRKYYDPNDPQQQVIFHNLGTGIADLPLPYLMIIQHWINRLSEAASAVEYVTMLTYDHSTGGKCFDDNKRDANSDPMTNRNRGRVSHRQYSNKQVDAGMYTQGKAVSGLIAQQPVGPVAEKCPSCVTERPFLITLSVCKHFLCEVCLVSYILEHLNYGDPNIPMQQRFTCHQPKCSQPLRLCDINYPSPACQLASTSTKTGTNTILPEPYYTMFKNIMDVTQNEMNVQAYIARIEEWDKEVCPNNECSKPFPVVKWWRDPDNDEYFKETVEMAQQDELDDDEIKYDDVYQPRAGRECPQCKNPTNVKNNQQEFLSNENQLEFEFELQPSQCRICKEIYCDKCKKNMFYEIDYHFARPATPIVRAKNYFRRQLIALDSKQDSNELTESNLRMLGSSMRSLDINNFAQSTSEREREHQFSGRRSVHGRGPGYAIADIKEDEEEHVTGLVDSPSVDVDNDSNVSSNLAKYSEKNNLKHERNKSIHWAASDDHLFDCCELCYYKFYCRKCPHCSYRFCAKCKDEWLGMVDDWEDQHGHRNTKRLMGGDSKHVCEKNEYEHELFLKSQYSANQKWSNKTADLYKNISSKQMEIAKLKQMLKKKQGEKDTLEMKNELLHTQVLNPKVRRLEREKTDAVNLADRERAITEQMRKENQQMKVEQSLLKDRASQMEEAKNQAELKMERQLTTFEDYKNKIVKLGRFTTQWQFCDDAKADVWKSYPRSRNKMIEALKTNQHYSYKNDGEHGNNQTYSIQRLSETTGLQINTQTKVQRKMRRIDQQSVGYKVCYPEWWKTDYAKLNVPSLFDDDQIPENVPGEVGEVGANYFAGERVTITQQSHPVKYKEIVSEFHRTVPANVKIFRIESVENPRLWDRYWNEKLSLKKYFGSQHRNKVNERFLWHGTHYGIYDVIVEQGFKKEHTSTAVYGQGTYFAVNAQYSVGGGYARANQTGEKRLFYCWVLCGESHQGNGNFKLQNWPKKTGGKLQHIEYDSLVDSPQNPTIYVIHNDDRIYPMFVVYFK